MVQYPLGWKLDLKKKKTANRCQGCRAIEHCGWQCKGVQLLWKTWGVLQKFKHRITTYPAIPLLDIHTKELKAGTWTDIWTPMFTAVLFTIAKR